MAMGKAHTACTFPRLPVSSHQTPAMFLESDARGPQISQSVGYIFSSHLGLTRCPTQHMWIALTCKKKEHLLCSCVNGCLDSVR